MDVEREREWLLEQIKKRADPRYQEGMGMAVPTELKVYGVRVPELRGISRLWHRSHKQVSRQDLLALVEALWNGGAREEAVLAIELLQRYSRWIPELTWQDFERWRVKLDNWEVTDGLGARVLAPWLLADPDQRLHHLQELIADPGVWSRRLALVATVPINRGHTGLTLPDLTLELVDQVKTKRDSMIVKAVSWALRELTKTHPERVAAYLDENEDQLAAQAVREVRNKLRTGLKNGRRS